MVVEPDNAPREQRRRRGQHEHIVGEAQLSGLLPKGYTLLSIIIAGTAYAAWAYSDISSNAESVQEVKRWAAETQPRVRILEQNQSVLQQQLKHIDEQQKRAIEDSREQRREIIDALKRMDGKLDKQ